MTSRRIQSVLEWLRRVAFEPQSELTRWQRAARFCYDLGRFGARQLRQDRAPQMAAALAFRTLFGLLPVLVVTSVIIRAMRGFDTTRARLERVFADLGLHEIRVSGASEADSQETLSTWLLGLIDGVESINLAAIGWVGLAVVIYSAIGLMVTIENSFNAICRAPEGRSWTRRVPVYWTVLSLGPLAIGLTIYFGAQLNTIISEQQNWVRLLRPTPVLWSFLVTCLVMFVFYKLIPNATVAMRPALAGAFVAALLVEIGKGSLQAYFTKALSFRQLYGSLGLIPVFMFWVYLMWLVVLFGLEVTTILQNLGGRRLQEVERSRKTTGLVEPASIVAVMEIVARRFADSRSATAHEIAEQAGLAESTVQRMLDGLIGAGLLHRTGADDVAVVLARPPEAITAEELIEIGFSLVDEGADRSSGVLDALRNAQRTMASSMTLASLAATAEAKPGDGGAAASPAGG